MALEKLFPPNFLYRYRPLNRASYDQEISTLADNYLWCANFKSMNDPMEGSYEASLNLKSHGRYRFAADKIFDSKISLGICSFSETNDNAPLWAHYADQFRGICIQYDLTKLLSNLDDAYSFVRISYSDKPHYVTQKSTLDEDLPKRILAVKSNKWAYEREWRLFSPNPGIARIDISAVKRIYLGNKVEKSTIKRLLRVTLDRGIPCCTMDTDGFDISFSNSNSKPKPARLEEDI